MEFLEMVAYTAFFESIDKWRCRVCPDQEKFSVDKIYSHLVEKHEIDKDDLKYSHYDSAIFRVTKEDDDESEVAVELKEERDRKKQN